MEKTNWKVLIDNYQKDKEHDLSKYPKEGNIYPKKENIFRCFEFFNIEDTKIVILGQDPYHTKDQATGLAFECNDTKDQPSLRNIKKLLNNKDKIDFEKWAKKGVLLLNCALTVEEGKAGSHMKFWLPFTKFIIDYLEKNTKCIFICWGSFSKKICEGIDKDRLLISSHPSPLSATKKLGDYPSFNDSKVFEKIKEKTGIDLEE